MVSVERDVFPTLIADGVPCYGWPADAYWRDIGSPIAYRAAQMDLLAGQVKTPLPPPGEARDGCWIDPSAFVATGALLEPPVVIGAEASVQVGARVGPLTVLGDHARIAPGARVEGSVLWERVEVGEGSVLRDCVIGGRHPRVRRRRPRSRASHRASPLSAAGHSAFWDGRLTRSSVLN